MKWYWLPIILALALFIAPASSPVQLSYVTSDSMEPTLHPGDGYVLVPAGEVEEGDVITFRERQTGEYVTHRAVEVTSKGVVTKGDANEVTDQSAGYAHVRRSAVRGKALTVGGTVVRIPGLGAAVSWIEQRGLALAGVSVAALLFRELSRDGRTSANRPARVGDILTPLLAGLGIFAVAMVFVAASTQPITYVALTADTDHPQRLTVGESATKPVLLVGDAPPFTHRVVSAEGMRIVDVEDRGAELRLTASIPPPRASGPYTKRVSVYHYPATLPKPMLAQLHTVHPLFAAIPSVGVLLAPLYVLALLWTDSRRPLRAPRSRRLREVIES